MASKQDKDAVASSIQNADLIREAMWGLIKGISAQRTFADMLIHSEAMNESAAPTLEEVAHMVGGMAERLDVFMGQVSKFVFDQVGIAKP